nr:ribonuclease inhibitor [Ipomoea batatas]
MIINLLDLKRFLFFRSLITYLEYSCKIVELRLENCELTCNGVRCLLECLSVLEKPPTSLSIGSNPLGSEIGASIGKFLCKGILSLDIDDIGLGSSGFLKAQEEIVEDLKIICINISKNRGGIDTAKFISKLFSYAPELVAINAGFNLMPAESLAIIGSGLVANGKLELLDLSGNASCENSAASVLGKFEINGKLVLDFLSSPAPNVPYDDDP